MSQGTSSLHTWMPPERSSHGRRPSKKPRNSAYRKVLLLCLLLLKSIARWHPK
ncbi:unnamed protein product, partial [Gulo gulo]